MALTAVARLAHRGAASNDHSGDGAGVLTQIPRRLLAAEGAVGMFFLPQAGPALEQAVALIERALRELGMPVVRWREVPADPTALGPLARASRPAVRQAFVEAPPNWGGDEDAWERRLYLARRAIERRAAEEGVAPLYVCSLSCRTVVYKALLTGTELPTFYPDLRSPRFETAIAVFHQRYSTNTLPSWPLAQPFHLLAHNGEINTLWGNRNAMRAREARLPEALRPIIWSGGSDSASLDNALELLVRSGRDPVHALMMLVPEAWEGAADVDPTLRSFYEFHAPLMEPWDGPAALAFSDGVIVGSAVDRNGLRPCRYKVTRSRLVIACSEVGVADLDPADVVESGRLGPGELLVVDTRRDAVLHSAEVKHEVAGRYPYHRWASRVSSDLVAGGSDSEPALAPQDLVPRQRAFGYGFEDLRHVLEPMASSGADAIWSMGDDTPIPPLSRTGPSVYAYVRQRFAQVTNPAIDPLRESGVMSLAMYLGRRGSLLAPPPLQRLPAQPLLRLEHPILLDREMAAVRRTPQFLVATLSAVWDAEAGPEGLAPALDRLCREAIRAARRGGRGGGGGGAPRRSSSATATQTRATRPSRCSSRSAPCTSGCSRPGSVRGWRWWPKRETRGTSIISPRCSATAPKRCTRGWPCSRRGPAKTRRPRSGPPRRRACSRSSPRWGSAPCGLTPAPSCSRRSASAPWSWTAASRAPCPRSAGSDSPSSRRMC
jgi:glutamate synthase domain-containing protein 1